MIRITILAIFGVCLGAIYQIDARDRTIDSQQAEIAALKARPPEQHAEKPDYQITEAALQQIGPAVEVALQPLPRRTRQ